MRVNINDQVLFVSWRYGNPELTKMIVDKGLSPELASQYGYLELCNILRVKRLPDPLFTSCMLYNKDKVLLGTATVVKHTADTHDKNKARTFSMHKLLNNMFEGRQNKGIRKLFWDAYLKRK